MSAFATVRADGPIRIIQVGAGSMGRAWLANLRSTPTVELVGIVDLDLDAARAAAGDEHVVVGDDLERVVAESGAQAVVDVTIPAAHHAVNTTALRLGLPVLCEKPIAPTVAEALSLEATSELTGQLLMTSQSRRYYPELARFRDAVRGLGRLGVVTTEFFRAPHFGGFREEMDHPLLVDMAIHAFDAARYVIGADPVSVDCRSFNPAWSWYRGDAAATASFAFEDGARYVYTGSWCAPGRQTSWNGEWRVSAEHGSAAWDGSGEPELDTEGATEPSPSSASVMRREIAGSLDEFIEAITSGRTPSGEVGANIPSLAMVEAAVRSAETREEVAIDSVMRDAHRAAIDRERSEDVRALLERGAGVRRS